MPKGRTERLNNAPKKPPSAFQIYLHSVDGVNRREFGSAAGQWQKVAEARWRSLSVTEQAPYLKEAATLLEAYMSTLSFASNKRSGKQKSTSEQRTTKSRKNRKAGNAKVEQDSGLRIFPFNCPDASAQAGSSTDTRTTTYCNLQWQTVQAGCLPDKRMRSCRTPAAVPSERYSIFSTQHGKLDDSHRYPSSYTSASEYRQDSPTNDAFEPDTVPTSTDFPRFQFATAASLTEEASSTPASEFIVTPSADAFEILLPKIIPSYTAGEPHLRCPMDTDLSIGSENEGLYINHSGIPDFSSALLASTASPGVEEGLLSSHQSAIRTFCSSPSVTRDHLSLQPQGLGIVDNDFAFSLNTQDQFSTQAPMTQHDSHRGVENNFGYCTESSVVSAKPMDSFETQNPDFRSELTQHQYQPSESHPSSRSLADFCSRVTEDSSSQAHPGMISMRTVPSVDIGLLLLQLQDQGIAEKGFALSLNAEGQFVIQETMTHRISNCGIESPVDHAAENNLFSAPPANSFEAHLPQVPRSCTSIEPLNLPVPWTMDTSTNLGSEHDTHQSQTLVCHASSEQLLCSVPSVNTDHLSLQFQDRGIAESDFGFSFDGEDQLSDQVTTSFYNDRYGFGNPLWSSFAEVDIQGGSVEDEMTLEELQSIMFHH